MSLENCCISGYQSSGFIAATEVDEATTWHDFAMSGDGSLAVTLWYYDDPVLRIYERSGSTWTLLQSITDTDLWDDFAGIRMSKDGNVIAVTTDSNSIYNNIPSFIKVYTRSGGTWSLTDTLSLNFVEGATTVNGNPVANRFAMSDDGQIFVYARDHGAYNPLPTINTIIIWDHGARQIILRTPGEAEYFGTSVGISGNGQYIFIGSEYCPDNTVTFPAYTYTSVTCTPGCTAVYEKAGGTWTQTTTFGMSVSDVEAAYPPWNLVSTENRTVSSYDGSVVAIGNEGIDHFTEIEHPTIPGTYMRQNINGAGGVQIFRKNGSAWEFEQLITNPFVDRIWAGASSWYGESIDMSSDGTKLLIGAPGINIVTLWEYVGSVWTMTRVFDAADDLENRLDYNDAPPQVVYWPDISEYGQSVRMSSDGSVIGVMEYDYYYDTVDDYWWQGRFWFYEECE